MAQPTAPSARVAPRTRLRVALIGHGIQLSRTPKMHMDEGQALGLDYRYDLIDTATRAGTADIGTLLGEAEASGLRGVNITHPYKQAALAHLDVLSDEARAVNAVNTVVFGDGKRFGHNTDYWGFREGFRRALDGAPIGRVVQLGAGGAGGAVAHALCDLGAGTLVLHDLNPDRAARLAANLRASKPRTTILIANDPGAALAQADGAVNATPVGMAAHPGSPVPGAALRADLWVADIIYFPLETELLANARAAGCRVMDGSGMAVFQAVRAFELFTGRAPDPDRMRATFDAAGPARAGS